MKTGSAALIKLHERCRALQEEGHWEPLFQLLRESQSAFAEAAPDTAAPSFTWNRERAEAAMAVPYHFRGHLLFSQILAISTPPPVIAQWLDEHREHILSPALVEEIYRFFQQSAESAASLAQEFQEVAARVEQAEASVALWSRLVLLFRLAMLAECADPVEFEKTLATLAESEFRQLRAALPDHPRSPRWKSWDDQFHQLLATLPNPPSI